MKRAPSETCPARGVPASGARGDWFLGNLSELRRDPLQLFSQASAAHADLAWLRLGPFKRALLVNRPDLIRQVLVENHKNYRKGPSYGKLRSFLGEGLLINEGQSWRAQRRVVQPAFHPRHLRACAETVLDCTRGMLSRWRADGLREVDLAQEMLRLTFEITGRTLFGVDVGRWSPAAIPALTAGIEHTHRRIGALWDPPWARLRAQQARTALRTLESIVQEILECCRRQSGSGQDVLSRLLARSDGQAVSSPKQLRDEVMTFLLAGQETTANGLTWAFYALARHPAVEERLLREAPDLSGAGFTFDGQFPRPGLDCYGLRVVQESLRLYPPSWFIERQALGADLLDGTRVRRGTRIFLSPWLTHRHPAFWEDPLRFDPERFDPARSATRPKFAYYPFGGGPRQCIGRDMALLEMQLILPLVLRAYRIMPRAEAVPDPKISLRPLGGLPVDLECRAALPAGKVAV